MDKRIEFSDLCGDEPADELKPFLDRDTLPEDIELDDFQRQWRERGELRLPPGIIGDDLIDAYCKVREEKCSDPGGWKGPCPYMYFDEIKDLCLHPVLMGILKRLIGTEMGLHLNLTGWVSTERNWHQDDYLNPEFVNSHYAAVWFALDDIHPDSGPFEFVPGSHRWPLTRREKVFEHLSPEERLTPDWPSRTQGWVSEAFEREIKRRGAKVENFCGQRGEVLIWHGRLVHRGSPPIRPGAQRKGIIAHYSALNVRKDMPRRKFWPDKFVRSLSEEQLKEMEFDKWARGGWYFEHDVPLDG